MNRPPQIILASASLRRQQLLDQIGIAYDVLAVDIDESLLPAEAAYHYVKRLAEEKAQAGFSKSDKKIPVLGADTTVVVDETPLGKPIDENDAINMLMRLSGKTHRVMTGVALVDGVRMLSSVNITEVSFDEVGVEAARAYWRTGEAADKAGAYAIQGLAAVWIKEIKGSFSGVMGLPLYETAQLLSAFNVSIWREISHE